MTKPDRFFRKENAGFLIDTILHGYSQILFAENKVFGLLILSATFVQPSIGLNGLLASTVANLSACFLGYSRLEIRAGLYGLNAVLLGMSISVYIGTNGIQVFAYIVLFSILLTVVTAFLSDLLKKYSLPSLSLPFVMVTWLVLLTSDRSIPATGHLSEHLISGQPLLEIFFNNIAYIVFSPTPVSGIIILAGLFFYSRIMCVVAVLSFLVCTGFVAIFPQYAAFIASGSFNAILTSLALAGIFFAVTPQSLFVGIAASVFSIIAGNSLIALLSASKLPVLTAPFNIITILTLCLTGKNRKHNSLFRIFLPLSPEENIKAFLQEREWVGKVDRRLSLPFMGWWFVSQGTDGRHTHKGIFRWGLDFIVTDRGLSPYKNTGEALDDYYCYNMPVTAPGDGVVTEVTAVIPDNPVTTTNLEYNWGNNVIIQHNPELFSVVCHLKQQAILITPGQIVKKGHIIGYCGSSGISPYPHLHVQFQALGVLGSSTIPVSFSDFLIQHDDYEEYIPVGIPQEEQVVMNVQVDSSVKKAVGFELGQIGSYELQINGRTYREEWRYDMDSTGVLFIESSLYGDRLYFCRGANSVSFIRYAGRHRGKKLSGLHALSIGIDKIPFYASDRLRFNKTIPYLDLTVDRHFMLKHIFLPSARGSAFLMTHTFYPLDRAFILASTVAGNKKPVVERSIIFDRGVSMLTFKTKRVDCRLKRIIDNTG